MAKQNESDTTKPDTNEIVGPMWIPFRDDTLMAQEVGDKGALLLDIETGVITFEKGLKVGG